MYVLLLMLRPLSHRGHLHEPRLRKDIYLPGRDGVPFYPAGRASRGSQRVNETWLAWPKGTGPSAPPPGTPKRSTALICAKRKSKHSPRSLGGGFRGKA